MQYREQIAGASGFTEVKLPANARQHTLQNLKVFARYGIKVAAVNEKGPGPFTPVYDVTTGEKRKLSCYPRFPFQVPLDNREMVAETSSHILR